MKKTKYFDKLGTEISDHDAFDRNGVLRDGVYMRVPLTMRDAMRARDAKPQFTDGRTTDPLALQRPGYRIPIVNDRRVVRDAYEHYETSLVNRYRVGDGVQCAQCYGSGEDEDGEDCSMCSGSGVMPGGNGDDLPDPASDNRTIDQHKQTMDQLYRQRDEELSNAWRQK
jgi:hypothetical protein